MKILTHNVYWFQGDPSHWGHDRAAEAPGVVNALTQFYASLELDVLCLQEVHRSALAETVARELGMASWLHAAGGLQPDYGGAVMSRRKAELRDLARADGRPPHERVHLRAALELDGERLDLAVIHLPSKGTADQFAGTPLRREGDAARVAELMRVVAEPPRPNVVVGDMNCRPDSPPHGFMLEAGYVDAAVVAGGDAVSKRNVDYMWLDEAHAGRLTRLAILDSGAFCRTTAEGTAWRLSDHPPWLMELR